MLTVLDENGEVLIQQASKPKTQYGRGNSNRLLSAAVPYKVIETEPEDLKAMGITVHKLEIIGESLKGNLAVYLHVFVEDDTATSGIEFQMICGMDTYGHISGFAYYVDGHRIKMKKSHGMDNLAEHFGMIVITMLKALVYKHKKQNRDANGGELVAERIVMDRNQVWRDHLIEEALVHNLKVDTSIINDLKGAE